MHLPDGMLPGPSELRARPSSRRLHPGPDRLGCCLPRPAHQPCTHQPCTRTPGRYSLGDRVERWLNDLLCLDAAEHTPPPPARLPHPGAPASPAVPPQAMLGSLAACGVLGRRMVAQLAARLDECSHACRLLQTSASCTMWSETRSSHSTRRVPARDDGAVFALLPGVGGGRFLMPLYRVASCCKPLPSMLRRPPNCCSALHCWLPSQAHSSGRPID